MGAVLSRTGALSSSWLDTGVRLELTDIKCLLTQPGMLPHLTASYHSYHEQCDIARAHFGEGG